jgi:hypothetical protein
MHIQKLLFASAVLAVLSGPACSQALDEKLPELDNCWYLPVGNPTGFEFDYSGNATGTIPAQIANDSFVNPFFGQSQIDPNFHYNQTTVAYDSSALLTRVILSGDALPNGRSASNPNPNHAGAYHMGLNGGWVNTQPTLASVEWLYPTSSLVMPSLQVSWAGAFNGKRKNLFWAAVYVQTKEGPSGCWHFTPYLTGHDETNAYTVANRGAAPTTIEAIGYELKFSGPDDPKCRKSPQCPGNEEALDELNDSVFPTPDEQGTKFITVKPPKKPLEPGESFTFKAR